MKQEIKWRIHPLRWMAYVLFLVVLILAFDFFRNLSILVIVFLAVLCPFVSSYGILSVAKNIQMDAGMDRETAQLQEQLFFELSLKNHSVFPVLETRIRLKLDNFFFQTASELSVEMPAPPKDIDRLMLPIQVTLPGQFRIGCEQLELVDLLGMISILKPVQVQRRVNVVPKVLEESVIDISGYLSEMNETEETKSKGSDYAEVSDVREYIPGDRLRDIHWKLSAKQDTLMVKERVSMAGSQMMLLMQLSKQPELTRDILNRTYALLWAFMKQQIPVCLLCWNQRSYEFEQFECSTIQELPDVFGQLYDTPLAFRLLEEQETYMKNCFPFLNTYLLVQEQNGQVQVVMCDNV